MADSRLLPRGRGLLGAARAASLLIACTSAAAAQETSGEVSGRVTNSVSGQAVQGALVYLPRAELGVVTGSDGRYRIGGVPAGSHVVLTTLMGCTLDSRAIDVTAGTHHTVNLALAPPVIDLEGLVVTAFAPGAPEAEVPFAVARVDPESGGLNPANARSVASLIRGQAPGVRVVQGSGAPGSEPSILLRGPTSIHGGQDPLVVVDGIVTQGRIADIDPLDVAHVEILKGAAASAAYGARGQAGVIEITTRRGPGRDARTRSEREPLVLIDGVLAPGGLATVDPMEIEDARRLDGPTAALLYGARAEAGLIEVTTWSGPPPGARVLEPVCLDPMG